MKSMEEMMKAAQEAAQQVQTQMEEAQKKLDGLEVEGQAGGGLVKVKATAKGRILAVTIDDSLMKADEKQMLEDLVAAAFNDARNRADAVSSEEMGKMTNGMQLPPGFKLPF
ncbi:YbaB/EbfC family nucleoid-associated protein [Parasphingorhabdus sp.]|uniref:YbaB/EbfC family nucleoid-associated protein n=1 Tax=Parasphingorhabdus sp. TaxID=2709688 RepID=UPI003263FED2